MDRARPVEQVADRIADELEGRLVAGGLFRKEARAMVNTWRPGYFRTEGIRALFLLPQTWTDEFIPIDVRPKPRELVRVMVGRLELFTPERERTAEAAVYGLGAILYEMLTARPPFQGESALDILRQVREREPDRPRSIVPGLPRDLETICLRCLEKQPGGRYASAEALADDLDRWLEGRPIAARRASLAERAYKWARRRPTAAALLLACQIAAGSTAVAVGGIRSAARWEAELGRREVARERAEVDGYAGRIAAAERAWSDNDVDRAWAIPDDCPGRLRRWEWHYLRRLCRGELRTIRGHGGAACGVAFVPETSSFTCPDHRGGLTIWDASADREVRHLRGHDGTAFGVAFDATGPGSRPPGATGPSGSGMWRRAGSVARSRVTENGRRPSRSAPMAAGLLRAGRIGSSGSATPRRAPSCYRSGATTGASWTMDRPGSGKRPRRTRSGTG